MINVISKDIENQEIRNSQKESFFDEEANKQGLSNIQKETNKEKKKQNEKIEKLKGLLNNQEDMTELQGIVRRPLPDGYLLTRRNMKNIKDEEIPSSYDPNNKDPFQIDAVSLDLSNIDIKKHINILPHAMFDTQTKRPKNIEEYFNPKRILEINKTPGLGMKELHKRGITGKNINIAIIDQALLMDHKEYKGKIKMYDEIDDVNVDAQMHGAAVTSIAVGENIGVAPSASVYYIGGKYAESINKKTYIKMNNIAEAIHRIIKKNKELTEQNRQNKIRVISISYGIIEGMPGYNICKKAIDEAEKKGIYVVCSDDKHFIGAPKDPKDNPDDFTSYFKALKNKATLKNLDKEKTKRIVENLIFVPMSSKTYASSGGNEDYTFDRYGGASRTMPYIAGVYALCCQVQPKITKKTFLYAVRKTAEIEIIEGIEVRMINPVKLIEYLEKN